MDSDNKTPSTIDDIVNESEENKRIIFMEKPNPIDEIERNFEIYKMKKAEEKLNESKPGFYDMGLMKEFDVLEEDMAKLSASMDECRHLISEIDSDNQTDTDGTEAACFSPTRSTTTDVKVLLAVKFRTSECCFSSCKRRMDNILLPMHHLGCHNDLFGYRKCYDLAEGQNVVLSFNPRLCTMKERLIIGLLAYSGTEQEEIFGNIVRERHVSLKGRTPIIVTICRTMPLTNIQGKELMEREGYLGDCTKEVYAIWLVSSYGKHKMNANLNLCGRDPANTLSTTVGVRRVHESQSQGNFMAVDSHFWILTYADIQKLSNNLRDELNLEIHLAERR